MKTFLIRYIPFLRHVHATRKFVSSVLIKKQGIISGLNYRPRLIYLQIHGFAILTYSHPYQESVTFSNLVFEHIKSFPEYHCEPEPPVSNVFDESSALRQLQSIIIHNLSPLPEDILKLFSLYAASGRAILSSAILRNNDYSKLLIKTESSIPKMSQNQLHLFAIYLKRLRYLRWPIFVTLSSDTYDECMKRIEDVTDSIEIILKYFIITMEMYGNSSYKKNGYKEFVKIFENCIHEATPSQIVQILHFAGLAKNTDKHSQLLWMCISQLSAKLDEISFVETGIAISVIFKLRMKMLSTSTFVTDIGIKLNNKLIESARTNSYIMNNLEMFSFVSLMKFLRSTSYDNLELIQNLKFFLMKCDLSVCDPQFICHTLAMFANGNFYDQGVFTLLEARFFNFMEASEPVIRLKDISRAMWSFSNVFHPCKMEYINLVKIALIDIAKIRDLFLGTNHFVDSLLALATYEIYDETLIKVTSHEDFIASMKDSDKGRQLSRLLLLHHIYKIIYPKINLISPKIDAGVLPTRNIKEECQFRPAFKKIRNALSWLNHECLTEVFVFKFLIPHIHYSSLVISDNIYNHDPSSKMCSKVLSRLKLLNNSKIVIEVKDSHNSVLGGKTVIGLEILKRNLLKHQGWDIKVVSEEEINYFKNDLPALSAFLIETFTSDRNISTS